MVKVANTSTFENRLLSKKKKENINLKYNRVFFKYHTVSGHFNFDVLQFPL